MDDYVPGSEEQEETEQGYEAEDDINFEEEYKPLPLIPQGFYHGAITQVDFDPEVNTIAWNVTLNGNDGVKSDGETPIDGSTSVFTNWLPMPGDENEMTKKGSMTKRQAKINMLHDFVGGMKLEVSTLKELLQKVSYGEYIGRDVTAKISIRKWEGRTFNSIEKIISE